MYVIFFDENNKTKTKKSFCISFCLASVTLFICKQFFSGSFPLTHIQHLCAVVLTNFRFVYLPFHFSRWWLYCCCCCFCRSYFFFTTQILCESPEARKKATQKSKCKWTQNSDRKWKKKQKMREFTFHLDRCLLNFLSHKHRIQKQNNESNFLFHVLLSDGKGKKNEWQYQISSITVKRMKNQYLAKGGVHRKKYGNTVSLFDLSEESENYSKIVWKLSTLIQRHKKLPSTIASIIYIQLSLSVAFFFVSKASNL